MPDNNNKSEYIKWFEENYNWSPEKVLNASQDIERKEKQNKQDEGIPIFGNGFLGNLVGGTAEDILGGGADFAKFFNFNNVSATLDEASNYFTERLRDRKPAEFTWDYISSPEGLARGTGNALGSLLSIATPGAGVELGAIKFLPKLANWASKAPSTAKWAMRGLGTVIPESAMEAGNFEKNAIANGMSPSEAQQKSWGVFGRNVALLSGSNALQWGMFPRLIGKGVNLGRR